ncbi:MAG TPA: hypothetical protein VMB50_07800 [Myxococcales bacterium]|nr:hypothetical protein [Myxococcales bacterium]
MLKPLTIVVATLALAACSSGDYCSQSYSWSQSETKDLAALEACADAGATVSVAAQFNLADSCAETACEKALPSCSAQDQQALQDELDCVEKAFSSWSGSCATAALLSFETSILTCSGATVLADGGIVGGPTATVLPDGGLSFTGLPYSQACFQAFENADTSEVACILDGGV